MKTTIQIEIDTKFRRIAEKDFGDAFSENMDVTPEVEEDFHDAVYDVIEKSLTDNETFEQDVLEQMNGDCPKSVSEFTDFGSVGIMIRLVSKEPSQSITDEEQENGTEPRPKDAKQSNQSTLF